jgi:pimeloyl-ACP methyl ester carboxylesterase
MPEVWNNGVRISYEVVGQGRPLVLLHGWTCDRAWWTESGYVDDLRRDHRVVNVDLRGHGASDKPHDPAAYRAEMVRSDVLAVVDGEGIDRFSIWGLSFGGWVAWMTSDSAPERVAALITTGAWDPGGDRPDEEDWASGWTSFEQGWLAALRSGGMPAYFELVRKDEGYDLSGEFPPWMEAVFIRQDPEAMLAVQSRKQYPRAGISDIDRFPVPTLLIAGELEDEEDDAAKIAARLPNGQRLRLPGLGHAAACTASEPTVPTARAFLERWFP